MAADAAAPTWPTAIAPTHSLNEPLAPTAHGEAPGADAEHISLNPLKREAKAYRPRTLLLLAALMVVLSVAGVYAVYYAMQCAVCSATGSGNGTQHKELRLYVSDPLAAEDLLLGRNRVGFLNSTTRASDIIGSIYTFSDSISIQLDGSLSPPSPAVPHVLWSNRTWRKLERWGKVGFEQTCTAAGTPHGCQDPGGTCRRALNRSSEFNKDLLTFVEAHRLTGIAVDWEKPFGNDVPCLVALWGQVAPFLHERGKRLMIDIDNDGGQLFDRSATEWSFEWDWKYYLPIFDTLSNMGSYPGEWEHQIDYPASLETSAYPCKWAGLGNKGQVNGLWPFNWGRCCGMIGQMRDFVNQGADMRQVEMGMWLQPCSADGLTTANGWTLPALRTFLQHADLEGVQSIGLFTDDEFSKVVPKRGQTCGWILPELRRWVLMDSGRAGEP